MATEIKMNYASKNFVYKNVFLTLHQIFPSQSIYIWVTNKNDGFGL